MYDLFIRKANLQQTRITSRPSNELLHSHVCILLCWSSKLNAVAESMNNNKIKFEKRKRRFSVEFPLRFMTPETNVHCNTRYEPRVPGV
jgi:hypothetical protein